MSVSTPDPLSPMLTALVSRPGIMQQSLRASLAACPSVEIIGVYGDGLTALNGVAQSAPALLVIDCNLLDEEVEALLAAVKVRQATTRCPGCAVGYDLHRSIAAAMGAARKRSYALTKAGVLSWHVARRG